jgi:hypothetical protein
MPLQLEDDIGILETSGSKLNLKDDLGILKETGLTTLKKKFAETPESRRAMGTIVTFARGIPFLKRGLSLSSGKSLDEVNRILNELEPAPQGIGEQLQKGVGQTALTLTMASPFLKGAGLLTKIPALLRPAVGFGAFEGAKALSQGDEPISPAISGAGSAIAFGLGGKLGASLMPRGVPFAETIGSILGGAGVGNILSPEGEKVASTTLGAGFGAMSPSRRVPLSSFGKFAGKGISSAAGVKPEVFQEVEQRGFRKVLQEKYYDRKMPEILQERIEGNLDALEKGAVGKFDEATTPLRKTKIDWAQVRGEVIKAYNKVKSNPFKGDAKQFNDRIAEGIVNTDAKNLGEVLDLRRFLADELYTSGRQGVKSKFGKEVYDIFNKYLHQNETLKQADAEWTTLQNTLREGKKLTGETGENFLKRFATLTGKQKESLALLEKQVGGEPFIEDLTNWSLAKEYGTKTAAFNFNPFSGFGLLTKAQRPLARGYLRGTEVIGKGLDIGQEKLNLGSEGLRSNLERTLRSERGSINPPKKLSEKEIQLELRKARQAGDDEYVDMWSRELKKLRDQGGSTLSKSLGITAGLTAGGVLANKALAMGESSTLGQRNNNPINLKGIVKWAGMTGQDKFGHAQFGSLEEGIRAGLVNLRTHQLRNPEESLRKYMRSFKTAKGDYQANYIAKALGISPDTKMKDLDMGSVIIPLARIESKIRLTPEQIVQVKKQFNLK